MRSLTKSAKYIPKLEFTTKERPITWTGVTASVNDIEGTVAFGFLQHFLPRKEYPLKSSLLMDHGYSSIATGIYPCRFNSASMYRTIFLLRIVNLLVAPFGTMVAILCVKFNSLLHTL